eukprot:TRINITY_DN13042_c0_g1_i1.p1 TRINITY_DN13042_c0_g1~~TRINITY_DN13042_c0_g1_i1.p1  ORF type:complete len:383 (-),score=42.78 TRINITY_DN13042_c0_g1_i1:71-1219(-)
MEATDVRALCSVPTPLADSLMARGCRSAAEVLARPDVVKEVFGELLHQGDAKRKADAVVDACQREVSCREDSWSRAHSALELLQLSQAQAPLVLPCQGIGRLLGGALRPSGALLEVCGLPGAGKTQLCLQLCAASQIPLSGRLSGTRVAGGDTYEAVFVDSEGSFVARRYAQVCRALLTERRPATAKNPEVQAAALECVLRGLHVCRAYDATELYSTVKRLGDFLKKRSRVRALVIDSIAFCFRHEFSDNLGQRARVLTDIAATLRRYGAEFGLVVVVTNHMTTRFDRHTDSENGWLAPALGETWAHQPSTQIRLERVRQGAMLQTPVGRATLTKSIEHASGLSCLYSISGAGIRDVDDESASAIASGAAANTNRDHRPRPS